MLQSESCWLEVTFFGVFFGIICIVPKSYVTGEILITGNTVTRSNPFAGSLKSDLLLNIQILGRI